MNECHILSRVDFHSFQTKRQKKLLRVPSVCVIIIRLSNDLNSALPIIVLEGDARHSPLWHGAGRALTSATRGFVMRGCNKAGSSRCPWKAAPSALRCIPSVRMADVNNTFPCTDALYCSRTTVLGLSFFVTYSKYNYRTSINCGIVILEGRIFNVD